MSFEEFADGDQEANSPRTRCAQLVTLDVLLALMFRINPEFGANFATFVLGLVLLLVGFCSFDDFKTATGRWNAMCGLFSIGCVGLISWAALTHRSELLVFSSCFAILSTVVINGCSWPVVAAGGPILSILQFVVGVISVAISGTRISGDIRMFPTFPKVPNSETTGPVLALIFGFLACTAFLVLSIWLARKIFLARSIRKKTLVADKVKRVDVDLPQFEMLSSLTADRRLQELVLEISRFDGSLPKETLRIVAKAKLAGVLADLATQIRQVPDISNFEQNGVNAAVHTNVEDLTSSRVSPVE